MSQTLITVAKFNELQERITAILGTSTTGAPQSGYGQTLESSVHYPVEATVDLITAQQYEDIYIDLVRARIHQVGASAFSVDPFVIGSGAAGTGADKAELAYITDLETLMTTIEQNKFDIDSTQISLELFDPGSTGYTDQRTSSWRNRIQHIFRIQFASVTDRRHFFNAGGEIRFESDLVSASGNKALDWADLLDSMGVISFDHTATSSSGAGTGSTIGNYDLTASNQLLFRKNSNAINSSGAYSSNFFELYGRNINDSTIEFLMDFRDAAGDNVIDDFASGTVRTFIRSATPFGTASINGTTYDTVKLSDPVYSIVTSLTSGN